MASVEQLWDDMAQMDPSSTLSLGLDTTELHFEITGLF